MCPTCLRAISLDDISKISEAHIVPQVAGGNQKTFICCDCNSTFGTKQDKWFGDLLRIANAKHPSVLATWIKDGYFEIDNIKLNGCWEKDQNGNFEFNVNVDQNPPETISLLMKKFSANVPKIQVSIPLPILKNQSLINIGFLTAGYLMWFNTLGYSWVFQSHLDQVREQILKPDKVIIESKYVLSSKELDWAPWFGTVPIDTDYVPVFGIKNFIVTFPPRNNRDFYQQFKSGNRSLDSSDIKRFSIPSKILTVPPAMLVYDKRVLVAPDIINMSKNPYVVINFSSNNSEGRVLEPLDEKTAKGLERSGKKNLVRLKLDP